MFLIWRCSQKTIQSFRLLAAKHFPAPQKQTYSRFCNTFHRVFHKGVVFFIFFKSCSSVLVNSLWVFYVVNGYRIILAPIPVKLSLLWYSLELAAEAHRHHGNSTSLCRNVTVILVWTFKCACVYCAHGQECRMKNRVKLRNGEQYLSSGPQMLSES